MQSKLKRHEQASRLILRDILAGNWKPGEALPPQRDLAQTLGYSQLTINRALAHLASRGYVVQRHGSGTYLSTQFPDQDIGILNVYFAQPVAPFWDCITHLFLDHGLPFRQSTNINTADLVFLSGLELTWHTEALLNLTERNDVPPSVARVLDHCPIRRSLGIDRQWWGVPLVYMPNLLFYRKDLFAAAGIPYPTAPLEWSDFENYASRLTQKETGRHGFAWQAYVTSAMPHMWQCDGGLLDRNPEGRLVSLISKPGTQRALAAWKTLGEITGYSPRNIPLSHALTARTDFLSGKAAMAIASGSFATALDHLNLFPWDVIPMPYLGRHISSGGLVAAGIGQHSRNPAQGMEAIALLLDPSAQQQLASSVAGLPALPIEPLLSTGFAGLHSVMREAMKTMRHDYFIPSSESYELIYGMFLDYWDGKENLASVCARFDDWVQAYNHGQAAAPLHTIHALA